MICWRYVVLFLVLCFCWFGVMLSLCWCFVDIIIVIFSSGTADHYCCIRVMFVFCWWSANVMIVVRWCFLCFLCYVNGIFFWYCFFILYQSNLIVALMLCPCCMCACVHVCIVNIILVFCRHDIFYCDDIILVLCWDYDDLMLYYIGIMLVCFWLCDSAILI
jgi:hypothetical protein